MEGRMVRGETEEFLKIFKELASAPCRGFTVMQNQFIIAFHV